MVTPDEVRLRLAEMPEQFIEPLETLQLSKMTRKKQTKDSQRRAKRFGACAGMRCEVSPRCPATLSISATWW